jgi:phosphonate transport system ATP-binding protein
VAIARALVQDPHVILADEPVSSVDPSLGRTIMELLVQLAETHKKTLVANLHAVSFALDLFPRVIGFRQGRVAFDLPPTAVSDAVMADLYMGMATSPVLSEYT